MRPAARRAFDRAFKAAAVVLSAPERRALELARSIFDIAVELGSVEEDPLPIEMRAPLAYLGQRAVPGILPAAQLPSDADTAADVVAYLTEGYVQMFVAFDRDHFDVWRRGRDQANAVAGLCLLCREPKDKHTTTMVVGEGVELRCSDGRSAVFAEDALDDAH